MSIYYFDTDALSWRYIDSSNPKLRAPDVAVSKNVNAIVESKGNNCYISEFNLLEWTSVIGKRVRSGEFRSFDYEWARKNGYSASSIETGLVRNDLPEGYQTLCMNCQFIKKIEHAEC